MVARRKIRIQGVVQGVGFRPFVFRLAEQRGVRGWIANTPEGIEIEAEAEKAILDQFVTDLPGLAPALAHIDQICVLDEASVQGFEGFSILQSPLGAERSTQISPDIATCPDCLHELFSRKDRRYLYPFINCTNCGPRYTIIQDIPYDRERTTMKAFPMCPRCREEYEDPRNRRFHAQPNACWDCGPRAVLKGASAEDGNAIRAAQHLLRQGKILAIKGLGGYHLAVDATQNEAVRRLRERKAREEKPFAIMTRDVETVKRLCRVSAEEEELLRHPARPIVLLRRLAGSPIAEEVAPHNRFLGVFLPYTPLHHLLFSPVEGMGDDPFVLVMTSGNLSEEPLAYEDDEAERRLGGIADHFLVHNREIHMRCDDSVARVVGGQELVLRRSRGYAPMPLRLLPSSRARILGCGAELKSTICLYKGNHAFLSQHIGDLENWETYRYYQQVIEQLERTLEIEPEVLACDMHPDYLSTQYALHRSGLPRIAVQHHHAHLCSAMAEHRLEGPCLGIICDGTGYGSDGKIWGCEFLVGDYLDFRRWGHLRYLPVPGGAAAIKRPHRMALSYLHAFLGDDLEASAFCRQFPSQEVQVVKRAIESGFNAPMASSLGRLFDAVASLLGVRQEISFEGQAAMELEMAAEEGWEGHYDYGLQSTPEGCIVDPLPLIGGVLADLQRGIPVGRMAASFHNTVVSFLLDVSVEMAKETGLSRVILSGGVFQNAYLLERLREKLIQASLTPINHRRVPPNDGGVALGQVAIANARLAHSQKGESS